MTACALCSAAAARSPSAPFDVGENTRQVCGRFGVVSLHPEGMRHLGEAPGQAAQRASLRRRANRSKGVAFERGGSDARRGRGSGGHGGDGRPPARWPQWALTPNSSRGPRPSAIARQIGQRNAGGRTSGAGVRRPRAAPASRTEELASAGAGRHRLAVGFGEPRRQRWLTSSSRNMPSSATVASAIARRRARPARGVKAGPVPSQTSCETIATPHAYTGRASRSRRARLRSPPRRSARAEVSATRGAAA